MSAPAKYRVRIRRELATVRLNAEQIDGKVYCFSHGWHITQEDSTLYVGEEAMLPRDTSYPLTAPTWIASGDLELTQ